MPNDTPDNESQNRFDDPSEDTSTDVLPRTELLSHEELSQKLGEAELKAAQYQERIVRMQADHENALRRRERDALNAEKYALEKFIAELLPIVDSLELCMTSTSPGVAGAAKSVIDGVDLTLKMFYTALAKFGIEQVNPLAELFDPEHQQAIAMQYDPSVKPGTVISVLQKGYTLNGRLLRPALVTVAKSEE